MQEESKYATMWVSEGILYFTFKAIAELDLKKAEILVASRLKFQDKTPYPVLCNIYNLKTVSEEAADYLATEGIALIPAIALLCNSYYHRVLAEVFIKFHNLAKPIQIFSNKQEALDYLQKFIQKKS
ncbi:hypothetical protein APR41_16100 [Salegentibacter salinarum]|uniref:DUF7793 domain-containing protein n=1 Tax=Salegentibacter salinarum TaxID=447422 RepID=A0A2N0TXK3_9FLAO|nr:hypothetical protein [Salegentibacter salinarum]PKD19482.1 hypothetical protein APR41_16100 [Salegentibacter salinarum]SKB91680.1 hypothetical protein SAMN05660903_03243 [Salegentibacter salinarum]